MKIENTNQGLINEYKRLRRIYLNMLMFDEDMFNPRIELYLRDVENELLRRGAIKGGDKL